MGGKGGINHEKQGETVQSLTTMLAAAF